MISGIPASPGIVFGKALVLKEEKNCTGYAKNQ
ncbi:phosphoenolpyruvate-protein phosphotransferase [Pasteurella multocida]|nr:phosphoenolpyruvate-protein phosphotransferase [Pasteurella multocida]